MNAQKSKKTNKRLRVQFDCDTGFVEKFDERFKCRTNNKRGLELRKSMKLRLEIDDIRTRKAKLIVREENGEEYELRILDREML